MNPFRQTRVGCSVCGLVVGLGFASGAGAQVGISSVLIDNPGNPANTDGRGSVVSNFAISQLEVTNEQYARFLNAVATTGDPGGLWHVFMSTDPRGGILRIGGAPPFSYVVRANMHEKPVNFVSWTDAARFCNWLHNGQPTAPQGPGTTESGAYSIAGNAIVTRNPGAIWFLPNEDEWYKAAYHDPVNPGADAGGTPDYWFYPTRSDAGPTVATATAAGDVGNPGANVANYNFGASWNSLVGNVTTVGSVGPLSASHFATYDQGGNVDELLETPGILLMRGGAWDTMASRLSSATSMGGPATTFGSAIGFRVASNFVKTTTFSVAPGTTGVAPPPANDVFLNPDPADLFFSTVQVKRDTTNKGNLLNIETQLSIGLQIGDDIDAVQGPIHRFPTGNYTLTPRFVFAVRPGSVGEVGTDVRAESPTNAGDLFLTLPPGHMRVLPEVALGLNGANPTEDLDALSLEPSSPYAPGQRIYFSLRRGSTTLNNFGWSGADILTAIVGVPGSITVAVPALALGLALGDDLDALFMVEGVDSNGDGDFNDPLDIAPWVYFSVDPLSTGLPGSPVAMQSAGNGAAADIFESLSGGNHNLELDNVAHLRLLNGDDIDALEAPEVECANPPFADFGPGSPPFGGGPPPNWPPKHPWLKMPLCYTIAICDTPFPKNWKGEIRQDYLDCSVLPPVMRRLEKTICGMGGSKAAAMVSLLQSLPCPGDPTMKMFGGAMVSDLPAALKPPNAAPNDPAARAWKKANWDPCIACDPQVDRIVAQVTIWANPMCMPNAKFCPLEISLTNYTISIVKPVPPPGGLCDRRIVGVAFDPSTFAPLGDATFELVFGTGDPLLPINFIPSTPVTPSSSPFFVLEAIAQQIRAAGGVAGVAPPTTDDNRIWLWVERTPVDQVVPETEVGGPVMIEGGVIVDGAGTWYRTWLTSNEIDCNKNQIPDLVDIALGAPDENDDGLPDSCTPPCLCPADFNCSGAVTVQDLFDFLAAWFARTPNADFNESGSVTVQDLFDYLAAWFARCL